MIESGQNLEQAVRDLGTEIFNEVRRDTSSVFDSEFYTGKLIDRAMEDEEFRVALFRFVDVLPSLTSPADIVRHVQEYFQPMAHRFPGLLKWGLEVAPDSLAAKATAALVKNQVRVMAARFILGETPRAALKALHAIRKSGLAFTVDLLGEAAVSEAESEQYLQRYLDLIRTLAAEVSRWPESAPLVSDHPGEATPLNISVKLSALYSQATPLAFERTIGILSERLAAILLEARRHGCFVFVDMENTSLTSITLETVRRVYSSTAFLDYERVGLVLQAYLRRSQDDLRDILDWARKRSTPLAVRLVKGAYWDTETIQAKLEHWPIPVWQDKAATDLNFESLARTLLDNHDIVLPAFGSHNIRSLCYAVGYAESIGLDPTAYELQALYGMADPIKAAFARRGYLVREYAPIGELIPGMGYLVRRLLENTSNQGFIRQGFHDHESPEHLLREPKTSLQKTSAAHLSTDPRREFHNCPHRDFSLEQNRRAVQHAVGHISTPASVRPIVGGAELECNQTLTRVAPHDRNVVVAHVGLASTQQAESALRSLREFFPTWRDTPVAERAGILFKTAEILESKRPELTAVMVFESGKPWQEADADIAEAIDFLNYYALQASTLFQPRKLGRNIGEDDTYLYEPRGVCAVISPWNFPLAIPCGMFSAAIVTGNPTALKAAEQSSLVAQHLFRAFLEAGLPPEAAAFLPGSGPEIGAYLVGSPHVATIAFTGSKEVGLQILNNAAWVGPGQEHVKRVIAEMGGKNAIIVDNDADLDQAVKAVVYSAFGYSGQKCSACSRVIVHEAAYNRFLERLAGATRSALIGPPTDPATLVGPVIDAESQTKLLTAIEDAGKLCRLIAQGVPPANCEHGNYVRPAVFADVPLDHPLWRTELFGPVVAVVKARDFDEALRLAMDSDYALTGAVCSRSPRNLQRAAREFRVGNLYLNRGCTGALVGRQPFGGARLSGVGSKAGGPDYLAQFVVPRAICENTIRQGFAPMG